MNTTILDRDMEAMVRMAGIIGKTLPHQGYLEQLPNRWGTKAKLFANGVHAKYRQLTIQWGMKFFCTRQQREENFKLMSKAARHGLAPKVGGKFQFKVGEKQFFGYITEHAPPLEVTGDDYPGRVERELEESLRAIGIGGNDLHHGNVALKNGRYIAIDLSCSTPGWYEFGAINRD